MTNYKKNLLSNKASVTDAIKLIDRLDFGVKIALIIDSDNILVGTVTDGDIRRAMLNAVPTTAIVTEMMNTTPRTMPSNTEPSLLFEESKKQRISQMPLINSDGVITDLILLSELKESSQRDNWVVVMAGGLGKRLKPLTDNIPKPMLEVGDLPLLERIIRQFIREGFYNFYLSVNYKAELVVEHFGNGEKFGIKIKYIYEDQPLGTAGALGNLLERPDKPFFVINGDILTNLAYGKMLDYHEEHEGFATMAVREYDIQIPYGAVQVLNQEIIEFQEKPVHSFLVNAGIYVLQTDILDYIPNNKKLDMPDLFTIVKSSSQKTLAFPIHENWLDIGKMDDYVHANKNISKYEYE